MYSPTQQQLTHVLQALFRNLKSAGGMPIAGASKATGGTTTTLIDASLAVTLGGGNQDDFLVGGTVIIVTDTGGVAPEGEFSRITGYDSVTTTITFSPALTTAPAAGDTYLYVSPEFTLYDMIESVNDALFYLGDMRVTDTSLTTLANTTEYTTPVALKRSQIADIWEQISTTPSKWEKISTWDIFPAVAGTGATLYIPTQIDGRKIMIEYWGRHPKVSAYSDPIDERISPDVMKWACLAHAYLQHGGNDQLMQARESQAWQNLQDTLRQHPINHGVRRVEGFPHWVSGRRYIGDQSYYQKP